MKKLLLLLPLFFVLSACVETGVQDAVQQDHNLSCKQIQDEITSLNKHHPSPLNDYSLYHKHRKEQLIKMKKQKNCR